MTIDCDKITKETKDLMFWTKGGQNMYRRIINDKYSKREELNNNTQSVSLQWPRPELAPPSPEEEREKSEIAKRITRETEIRRRFGTMSHEKILQLFGMK